MSDTAPRYSPRALHEQNRRVPPHDYDAERATLGAILLDEDALNDVIEILGVDDFYRKTHGIIFQAIIDLVQKGAEVDLITLGQKLKQDGTIDDVGGGSYLAGLTEAITSSANASHFAQIVKDLGLRRRLLHLSGVLATEVFDLTEECRAILEKTESNLFNISQDSVKAKPIPGSVVVKEVYDAVMSRAAGDMGMTGITTGFTDLDNILSGFHDSEFVVIGARPSVGKTALAINILSHIAVDTHVPAALFSLEMTAMAIMQRMLSGRANISATKMRTGIFSHVEKATLRDAVGPIYSSPLWIVDTPHLMMMDLRALARRLIREHGVRIIFIDYLTLISADSIDMPRHEQVGGISRSLKAMARELEIPVVVLSQVTRDSEGRKPTLATIRESGSIEQDADVVLFLHRQANSDDQDASTAQSGGLSYPTDLVVAKQRNGPVGTIQLQFFPQIVSFKLVARDTTDGRSF